MNNITKIYLVENCYGNPNKVYIGKTKNNDNSRKNEHKKRFGKQIIFTYIDQVESLDKQDWEPLETFWIRYFKFLGFDLQNKNEGGGGSNIISQKTRDKMSKAHNGKKLSQEHKNKMKLAKQNISQETRNKISLAKQNISQETKLKMSENSFWKGKNRSEKTKLKISLSKQNISQETRDKMRNSSLGKSIKIISQYNLNGEFIRDWDGLYLIKKELNIREEGIIDCCKNRIKSFKGFRWTYKNETLLDNIILIKTKINNKNKPIIQYNLNGDFIREWHNIISASKELKIDESNIGSVCKGKVKSAGKFKWSYKSI
jgi:hypothetical protein